MMCRETLVPMGVPLPHGRDFDMTRVIKYPEPLKILEEVIEAAKEVHLLGLDTLKGCTVKVKTDL